MRLAVSVFHKGLQEGYKRAGIVIDFDSIHKVQWLPEIPARLAVLEKENESAFMASLPALKEANRPMWRAIMIARYAGLRSKEIKHARKSWLVKGATGWQFQIQDRPEDGFWHKTGEFYVAPILSTELEEDLLACPDGLLVPFEGYRDAFFNKACNQWLRQFIPRPNKGLHRLRALYLEHLKNATVLSVKAEQAGIEAARQAAGHTTAKTTTTHYLPQTSTP
jgi:integrase